MKHLWSEQTEALSLTPEGQESGWIWVHSDLQLSQPELAIQVLGHAVEDLLSLDLKLDGIWNLGDSLCGARAEDLKVVASATLELLERFGVPIVYLLGNHEMDQARGGTFEFPLWELAQGRPLWHLTPRLEDPVLIRRCFGMEVFFLGDHADPGGRWMTSHHKVQQPEEYPFSEGDWKGLRGRIEESSLPVLTVSHYAYPGGQRPGPLMETLLPLPAPVVSHFHGHAHIGDLVHNKERPYQRENPIDGSSVCQYNISALETRRSAGSHSALLWFEEGRLRKIRIRCHLERKWVEEFAVG